MSEQVNLVNLGMLRGDTSSADWTGSVSVQERLDSGELNQEMLDYAAKLLGNYFVPVAMGAPKRCVDGRSVIGYNPTDPAWANQQLGVQIQGGTEGDAIGQRLAIGYSAGATLLDDLKLVTTHGKNNFAPGGHNDDHSQAPNTGCGHRDGQTRRLPIYTDRSRGATLRERLDFTYNKAGLVVPKSMPERLTTNATSLLTKSESYFKDNHKILDWYAETDDKAVRHLTGVHNEVSATLNFVQGTTFNPDAYNLQTKNLANNFNVDVWNILDENGEDAYFVLADAMTTLMDLTKGDLQLFARVPVAS